MNIKAFVETLDSSEKQQILAELKSWEEKENIYQKNYGHFNNPKKLPTCVIDCIVFCSSQNIKQIVPSVRQLRTINTGMKLEDAVDQIREFKSLNNL